MAGCESVGIVKKVSKMKLQHDEENPPMINWLKCVRESNHPLRMRGPFSDWYDRNPTGSNPAAKKIHSNAAELAIDVYNKTHLKKYSSVVPLYASTASCSGYIVNILFTAKNADDKFPDTFQARVYGMHKFIEYVELVPPADLLAFYRWNKIPVIKSEENSTIKELEKISMKKLKEASVWYDVEDPTCCCDPETMKIVKDSADLAIEVHNKTHFEKYILVELVHASGGRLLSAGSMVDVTFIGERTNGEAEVYDPPKTFRARVSVTHSYVEFVGFVPPAHPL